LGSKQHTHIPKVAMLIALQLALSVSAFAQSAGTINGRVVDPQSASVPGAALTLKSPELQGQRSAVTDSEGNYTFLGLPPGTYQLTVSANGFQPITREGIQVRAGLALTIETQVSVSGVAQSVNITGRGAETSIIDTSNPEQKFNISGEFLSRLPLNQRQSWESVWYLVPGVVIPPNSDNRFEPRIHGAFERANSYRMDGVEIGNAFTNQGWTTQFSTEAIQDVQIKTAGQEASTPLGSGGYIDVVTKSGGNSFHGSAAIYLQPRSFNWSNVPGGTSTDQEFYQPDFSFGGPIIKDRTWFFGTYRRVFINQGIARSAEVLKVFDDNGFTRPDYDLQERNDRIQGKITHKITDNHLVSFNYLNDRGLTLNSDSRDFGTQETTIDIHNGGPMYFATWNATFTPRLLLNVRYGYRVLNSDVDMKGGDSPAITRFSATTVTGGNLAGQTGSTILQYGNRAFGFATGSKGERNHQELNADLSYVKNGWGGQHTFQTGMQWKPRSFINSENVHPPSGLGLVEEVRRTVNGTVVFTPFHRQFRNPTTYPSIVGVTRLFGGYIQDKWVAHPRLTLNLGVRFDNQRSEDAFDVERANTVSVDPRIGAAWRITDNGRDVIRVSWARLHDPIYVQAAPSFGSRTPEIRDEWDNNLDGAFETTRITPSVGINSAPNIVDRLVDPDLGASYADEFQIGYTRQLPGGYVFNAAYIDRRFKDEIGTLDANIIYEGGLFRGYRNPAVNAILMSTNLKNYVDVYRGLDFSIIRNIGAKLQLFASYSYQKKTQTGDFAYDDINGYLNPREWYDNDKRIVPHMLRLNGSYILPWRFTAAAIISVQSGNYGGPLTKTLAAPDPAFGPAQLTLPNGRVVNNPLATTTRLVGPRSEDQLQLPTVPRINLRLGKEFRFKESQVVELNLDFFNITNDATPLSYRNATNTSVTTTFAQFTSTVQTPRGAQISVRYRF
jgi:hypothetical protein